jgi:diphthine-ammonia ligase
MCGIIGFFNAPDAGKAVMKGLHLLKERGKDGFGIAHEETSPEGADILVHYSEKLEGLEIKETRNALGHSLHAMVGMVHQPIQGKKGLITANCEIYNWKSVAEKHGFRPDNDADALLKLLDKEGIEDLDSILKELSGVYAFAYWVDGKVILARDILGIKPLWFSLSRGLAFASEKKALIALGCDDAKELNPREILRYDIGSGLGEFIHRPFFELGQPSAVTLKEASQAVLDLLTDSMSKRLPGQRFGILFSGGVDSSTLAMMAKRLGADFTCYTAVLDESHIVAEDLVYAEKAAAEHGFHHRVRKIRLDEVPELIRKVVPLIEDSNVVKVGVALTFYAACELAKEDGVRVIFSGLGSEEIFAGYDRHRKSPDVNKECLSGLMKLYERDTYRDDVVTMSQNIELRLPFLDLDLVNYSLKLPARLKLDESRDKIVLREVAKQLGLRHEFADRKKRAAQYGSRFDKAIERLARRERKQKSEYLKSYYAPPNLRLGVLFSGGKDSCYAMHVMQKQNYKIECLITMLSENKASYMFHTPNVNLAALQAEAMGIPIIEHKTKGRKEQELEDLEDALSRAKLLHRIEGVVTGALFSEYQRSRVEKVCDKLGLKIFSPLWHMDQEQLLRQIVEEGFEVVLSSIAAFGLDQSFLGRRIDINFIQNLKTIHNMYHINMAGEGGEYESLVIDGPMFRKRIRIMQSEILVEDSCTANMVVSEAVLEDK